MDVVSQSATDSLWLETEILRVLERYGGRDQYEIVGMTGIPLSAINRGLEGLLAEGRIESVLTPCKKHPEGHLRYATLAQKNRPWPFSVFRTSANKKS